MVEGTDGSGRSTQISLLTEWLESEGFAVETMGLRRSFLVGEDIDALLAENAVTRTTLALMYGTDFFDQLERRILPALRSGLIVLADRYIFTLIARAAVRGIGRDYLHGIYDIALRPDLTFWLNVRPEVAFDREFKKSQTISYWESGRDMSLSNDLFQSFIRYQSMIKREFEYLSKRHGFIELDGEANVSKVNGVLRKRIASQLGHPQHALQAVARARASLALRVAAPVQLAAIDAGSNAIRLVIARATSPQHIQILESERAPVRLGHNAFTRRLLDEKTISRAARAFRHFRDRMDHHHVTTYRAVATAAAREVRNYRRLMERIQRKTGIELEVISSEEEARLVCSAVHWALGDRVQPRLIFDLGGGSLELNFFERGVLRNRVALPLGTIRLMETYSIDGAIDEDTARRLRHHVLSLLRSAMPSPPNLSRAISVACGGNAEALVRLAPGPLVGRTPTINVRLLQDQTWRLMQSGRSRTSARVSRAKGPRGSDGHRRDHHHVGGEMARPALDAGARSGRARRAAARSGGRAILRRSCFRGGEGPRRGIAGRRALVCAAPGLQRAARRAGLAAGAFALRSTAPDS